MSWLFPTPEEAEARGRERDQKRLANELKKEARYYARLISDVLAELGLDHYLRKENRPSAMESITSGRRVRQKVSFTEVMYDETSIYFRLDTRPGRMPYRVHSYDFRAPEILESLSIACGCQVEYKAFPDIPPAHGAWFVLYRDGAVASIPRTFSFKDALNNIPASATPLRYCAGVAANMSLIMPDLAMMPHLLIAGSTGTGKSVHLNNILLQFLWRNGPDRLQLMLIDLKGGMELQDYENIPHLFCPIVTKIEDVIPALEMFKKEMDRRQNMFAGRCRDLTGWNRISREKLPYLLLVVDELAQILKNPNSKLAQSAERTLGGVLNVSRATGGHAILCTQRPSVDVVTGYLKTNVPARIAFAVPTDADSRVILDSGHAAGLEIPGRGIMLLGAKRSEVQTPLVTGPLIRKTIKAIVERGQTSPEIGEVVTLDQVLELALDNFNGSLARRQLYSYFDGKIGQKQLQEMLASIEGQIVTVKDQNYFVEDRGGRSGRWLVPVTDDMFVNAEPQSAEVAEL